MVTATVMTMVMPPTTALARTVTTMLIVTMTMILTLTKQLIMAMVSISLQHTARGAVVECSGDIVFYRGCVLADKDNVQYVPRFYDT